jgi:TolA-binding protein
MSISGVSSNNNLYQTNMTSINSQRKQDFQNLASALQSGDLSSAQKAFAQLQQDGPKVGQAQSSQNSNQSSGQNNPFQALASALQSGDLSGAQQAFSQLQQSMKSHHHHHKQGAETSQSSNTNQITATTLSGELTTSTNGQINVTI